VEVMSILSNQIHDLKNLAGRIDDTNDRKTITDAVWTIEQLSEKAREVHAHWNIHFIGQTDEYDFECSVCHKCNSYKSLFCPSCGAKMDEEGTEERADG
jgi:rRNA maturation endonuclease Nob1